MILRRGDGVWSKVVPTVPLQTPRGIWVRRRWDLLLFFYGATPIRFKNETWAATGPLPVMDEIRALCGAGTGATIELFGGGRNQLGGGATVGTYGTNGSIAWQSTDPAKGQLFSMIDAMLCVSPTEVYAA